MPRDTKRLNGVIFDNDDTVHINAEAQWLVAHNAALAHCGLPPMTDDMPVRQEIKGIGISIVHQTLREKRGMTLSFEDYYAIVQKTLLAVAPESLIAPGFVQLLDTLERRHVLYGIASSARRQLLNAKWERFPNERQRMKCFVAGDDVPNGRGKPNPDMLLLAAQHMGLHPTECAYVGDARSDVLAALNAGMIPILISHHGGTVSGIPNDVIKITSFREMLKFF